MSDSRYLTLRDANALITEGSVALSDMSRNGMRLDVEHLQRAHKRLEKRVDVVHEQLLDYPQLQELQKRRGTINLHSTPQLQELVYDICGNEPIEGQKLTDKESLTRLDVPFAEELNDYRYYYYLMNTCVSGLLSEQVNGYVRPSISLLGAVSYRSNCSLPNLQNIPVRDPFGGRMIRTGFIPRDGRMLTEFDFKGMELCVQACCSQDAALCEYMQGHADGTKDLHWDMSKMLCMLDDSDYTKLIRKMMGKNGFVFPTTYGSWWVPIAEATWSRIDEMELADGTSLRAHLARKGIFELGEVTRDDRDRLIPSRNSWYEHVKNVQNHFWNDMFPELKQWRENTWQLYKKQGYFRQLTGFVESGLYNKNEALNHGIQGSAFHILLKALIESNKLCKSDSSLDAMPVLQVHDSIMFDHTSECADRLTDVMQTIVDETIPNEWSWIIVPLVLESDQSHVDGSWWDMEE